MHLQSRIIKKAIKPLFQKQVVYLVSAPFTKRDFERFGVKNWIKSGWKVKVFDITSFVYPKYWQYIDGDKISCNFEGLTIFKNINEVLSAINNLKKKVVFIDHLYFSSNEDKIRKAACAHGAIVRLKLNLLPSYKIKINKNISYLFSLIKNLDTFTHKLILFIKNKIIKIRSERFLADYTVVSGSKSILGISRKKTSVIYGHNFDYDIFLKKKYIKSKKKNNYLVFLDGDGPYHSDYLLSSDGHPYLTKENYYPTIDSGLDEISKSLKLNIQIAKYPISNYKGKGLLYKYPFSKIKTFELIRNADVVLTHYSTAAQWAIIMKKPLIFITTDEIEKHYEKDLIYKYAKLLGKKVINFNQVTKINNWRDHLNVNDEKYEKYIENYIKKKHSPEKLLWNIVIEHIEKDLFI